MWYRGGVGVVYGFCRFGVAVEYLGMWIISAFH